MNFVVSGFFYLYDKDSGWIVYGIYHKPGIAAELFPGTDPAKLSFTEMVDFLRLKRFGSLVDSEMNQQVFILDLSFNPEITDELMVIYFDLNKEIFCITHES